MFKSFFKKLFHWQIIRLDKINNNVDILNNKFEELKNIVSNLQVDISEYNNLLKTIDKNSVQQIHKSSVSKIRVVFLIHVPEFWYALKPIFDRMMQCNEFQPIIVTVVGALQYTNFESNAALYFQDQKIKFIDISDNDNCLLELINPDIIFKQTPWEQQYPEAFRTANLSKFRICYIPYGIHTNPIDKVLYNDDIHRYGWRLYCVNDSHREKYAEYNIIRDINTVVSGYTKFEYIANELIKDTNLDWPIISNVTSNKKIRIIWAPHHSLEGWLGFCTFFDNYQQIIQFAKDNADVEIVFRPHPALYEVMISQNKMTEDEVNWFNSQLSLLPNCYLDEGAEYIHLFKHSDILITDGVGFLFEYLLTGKPIIHIDSKVNCGFNDYYKQIEPAWYKAYEFDDVEKLIAQLRSGDDPLKHARQELVKLLYPISDKEPSEIICDDIRKSILGK